MPLHRVLSFLALALLASPALAVGQGAGIIRGRISDAATGAPLVGVQVRVDGTPIGAQTGTDGTYTITGAPAGSRFLSTRRLGYAPQRVAVTVPETGDATQDFALGKVATTLNEVVVTALGQTTQQRSLGTAQQSVRGEAIAETQRENFVNALQGRIAGVDVTSTSGVPGASSSITIRGISSISSSNQPLMIVDGLPMDNRTMNTGVLASDASSTTAFSNRGVDFTNRSADLNPEDIESLTVLKGPEAAALYGIDAANGAIVITTKRGKPGGGLSIQQQLQNRKHQGEDRSCSASMARRSQLPAVGSHLSRTSVGRMRPERFSTTTSTASSGRGRPRRITCPSAGRRPTAESTTGSPHRWISNWALSGPRTTAGSI